MGYSCTAAALKALQAIKGCAGGDLDASNELRLARGRLAFFERGDEQADGAIVGMVYSAAGERIGPFRINADGTIHAFPGLRQHDWKKAEWLAKSPEFHPTVAVI
jgi:hypothetical protein